MMNMLQMARLALRQFVADEEGATAVEYGLIVGLIAVAIAAILFTVGGDLNTIFGDVHTSLTNPSGATGGSTGGTT